MCSIQGKSHTHHQDMPSPMAIGAKCSMEMRTGQSQHQESPHVSVCLLLPSCYLSAFCSLLATSEPCIISIDKETLKCVSLPSSPFLLLQNLLSSPLIKRLSNVVFCLLLPSCSFRNLLSSPFLKRLFMCYFRELAIFTIDQEPLHVSFCLPLTSC